jgi:hypothetical protein
MGCCCSFLKNPINDYYEPLITNRYCHQCKTTFISNNEYNKHIVNCNKNIVNCNKIYGDY